MYCPRCGTRNALGSARCDECGAPFTRRAVSRRRSSLPPPPDSAPVPPLRREVYERRTGVTRGAVPALAILFILAVLVLAGLAYFSTDNRASQMGETIQNGFGLLPATDSESSNPDGVTLPDQPPPEEAEQQWVITQSELNQQVAARTDSFGQVDSVSVDINNDEVVVNMSAYGVPGTYRGHVIAQNGVPVVMNGSTSGPLGWVVSSGEVEQVLNDAIGQAIAGQGVYVESVQLRPGEMVLGVS